MMRKKFAYHLKKIIYDASAFSALLLLFISCDKGTSTEPIDTEEPKSLPDITEFLTNKTDQFIVDIKTVDSGNPFKGLRSKTPHAGAHTHWESNQTAWPEGIPPEQYPAIYAVSDGIIHHVEYKLNIGAHDRYGIDLVIATSDNKPCWLCYAIEPFCFEPSDQFYHQFILVSEGDTVKKGDVIAYMYIPANLSEGLPHIHFHLMVEGENQFLAPALFTQAVVDSFHVHWGEHGYDAGDPIPPCMGYMLTAEENPFGTGEVDTL